MRSSNEEPRVLKFLPFIVSPCMLVAVSFGLIVATSKDGLASAAISFNGGGGAGISHAVSFVARTKVSGIGFAWVHVPTIELSSPLSFPS
jgi:hypothetical protein